jgi:hypothetical protein
MRTSLPITFLLTLLLASESLACVVFYAIITNNNHVKAKLTECTARFFWNGNGAQNGAVSYTSPTASGEFATTVAQVKPSWWDGATLDGIFGQNTLYYSASEWGC